MENEHYIYCPCGGKIHLTQLTEREGRTFVRCESCQEEFPLDKDGFLNADVMINKINRVKSFHMSAIGSLKSSLKYWESMKYRNNNKD